jgi:hypothetical protein
MAMDKVDEYTQKGTQAPTTPRPGVRAGEAATVSGPYFGGVVADAASAGVPLYKSAQTLEQLSRTDADRKKNAREIRAITNELENARFVTGFGSIGGEEFFSYLNISDGLHRAGGTAWEKWNGDMKTKVIRLQNDDGTWSGQHCITGRVAVTSAAILLLLADRDAVLIPASAPKN